MSELKLRPPKEEKDGAYMPTRERHGIGVAATGVVMSGEEDLGFGFDDEEGVGVGMAGGAELLEGVVEGGG